jgi:hypothetical protein
MFLLFNTISLHCISFAISCYGGVCNATTKKIAKILENFAKNFLITKLKEKTLILIRTKSKDFGFCLPKHTKKIILVV